MQSTFKALNVESDNESEDEVDNTKEIQIEDALKLYQTALKFHSEGPQSFDKAVEAYKALFESDIFKYTESLSEFKRHELFGENLVFDSILQDEFDAGPVQLVGAGESAPTTLNQILHLSYKNHGQFLLETMQHWISQHRLLPPAEIRSHIVGALSFFAEALDKEDTDLDLWIRTASVAAQIGSQRITRFCLEAVLDGEDELVDSILRLPGLEEGFAGQQLREMVTKLEDSLSLTQAPLSTMKRKKFSEALKKRLNPYPSAPLPSEYTEIDSSFKSTRQPERIVLSPVKWDWAGVGEVILHHYMAEQGGYLELPAGCSVTFSIPPGASIEDIPETISMTPAPREEIPRQGTEALTVTATEVDAPLRTDVEDVAMEEPEKSTSAKNDDGGSASPQETVSAQTRKRSTDSAGLPETAEGGRLRSKRIRGRASERVTEVSAAVDNAGPNLNKQIEDQLWPFVHADQCLSEVINDMFGKLGVNGLGSPQKLRDLLLSYTGDASTSDDIDKTACDMFSSLQHSGPTVAAVFLNGEPIDLGGMSREAGLSAFLGFAKPNTSQASAKPILASQRLANFAQSTNNEWLSLKEVAFAWLEKLLLPGYIPCPNDSQQSSKTSYMRYRWAEDLKRHLVQIIVNFDDFIYERLVDRISCLDAGMLEAQSQSKDFSFSRYDESQIEMVETLFELHLDIYSLIKHPHSGVDPNTQIIQQDRLERWSVLARDALQLRSACNSNVRFDELDLRHLWASVFQMSVNDDIQPEHVLYAMAELKAVFQSLDGLVIEVQNNAVMPELSIAAIDRELARISMKDFFLRVFDQDEKDPVAVIESLEPILEPSLDTELIREVSEAGGDPSRSPVPSVSSAEYDVSRPTPAQEMKQFLDSATVSLRNSLWQRLREAYEAIEYTPKVISCYLRSIETLMSDFKSVTYHDCALPERYGKLFNRLRTVDEIIVNILQIIRNDKTAFDCLSYEHLQTSMTVISETLRIFSGANMFEDMVRIGQYAAPKLDGLPHGTFEAIANLLHDMQLRAWILQYHLLSEGISQASSAFPTPADDQFEFLRHVHHATGVRGFCHMAGRQFLRLAKDEILRLDDIIDGNNRDNELSQVCYDLYGLKTFIDPMDRQEFGSTPDLLDKKNSSQLLPFILSQSEKVNIKDLPKTELKDTIDKVHQALGRAKPNADLSFNSKILKSYFRAPINPISLFSCLKGIGSLSTKHISPESAMTASKGWLFLMGNMRLNEFRSRKRLTQGPTEDLNYAQAFFLEDLEYSVDRWETWYRLAQANDTHLEEAVSWNADKMNAKHADLFNFQRNAINCYTMAVACAVRDANPGQQTMAKVSQLYTDFGNRIYASSREPFNMTAFSFVAEKEYRNFSGASMYKQPPFVSLSPYNAWKFASVLFKRAIRGKPDKWWNYYMLGKCLWKMYCANLDAALAAASRMEAFQPMKGPTWEEVIDAFVSAIENLPEKRERGREPVLEPHYKLVSIVHKLFQRRAIDHERGLQILLQTSYSQNITRPENQDDWERYILAVLKALRTADKSSWHHRIIARSAHVIYDDSNDMMVAHGAKHELTQQMFTKTMTVQVWKPEHERPGRHFVYTSRYTKFFVHLLDQTGDKANLEALAKRVRRKQTDFFEHYKLWNDLCLRYLKVLRRVGQIPDGHEDAAFKAINHDEFSVQAMRLEAWCQDPTTQNPVLNTLRDVIELKRMNNGLMKPLLLDDLIGDTYGLLYTTIGPTLSPLPSEQPPQPPPPPPPQPLQHPGGMVPVSSLMSEVDGPSDHNPNIPFSIYHPSQPLQGQQQPPQQTEPAPKSRAKTVGRREIQRKAEACVAKIAGATQQIIIPIRDEPGGLADPSSIPDAQLPSMPIRGSPVKPSHEVTSGQMAINDHLQQVANGGGGSASGTVTAAASVTNEDSRPGSIHDHDDDDADDESELSELDESEVQEIAQEIQNGSGRGGVGGVGGEVAPRPFAQGPFASATKASIGSAGKS
jgi:hypothetical protein